jgi:hypothetical protein
MAGKMRHLVVFAVAALLGALAAPASAQPGLPSYATNSDQPIHGRVAGFDGKYALSLRDDHGYTDRVELHDGTIINPTGLRLAAGMTVTIYGHADGSRFVANEIDTRYQTAYAYPYPAYPYYPYPYYGPSFRFGFRFR